MAISSSVLSDATLSTQMNTRIERALKMQGDAVLERLGISPSQAVRSLWSYLAHNDDIPEYMKAQRQTAEDEKHAEVRSLAEAGKGLAVRLAVEKGLLAFAAGDVQGIAPLDYDQMEDLMYEEMLDDYHANCR